MTTGRCGRTASWWSRIGDLAWPDPRIRDRVRRRADAYAEARVESVIHFGFHCRFDFAPYLGLVHGLLADIAEALHARGIRFLDHMLELLARHAAPLSQIISELPPFYVASGHIEGLWETKGRVMRCLINQFSKLRHETVDGIKVYISDHEWVLIRPDNDTSMFHLTAEARSLPLAQELIADYGGIVRQFVHEPCAVTTSSAPEF